jgi:hypothetical protein
MLEHRHPACIRPHRETASAADFADRQAARIADLEGQLASARGRLHDANNHLTCSLGALEMIASLLGLPNDATPPAVLAEAMRRFR